MVNTANGFGYHLHCKTLFAFKFLFSSLKYIWCISILLSFKDHTHPIGFDWWRCNRSILKNPIDQRAAEECWQVTGRFSRSTDFNIVYHYWSFEPFELVRRFWAEERVFSPALFEELRGGVLANLFIQIIYIILSLTPFCSSMKNLHHSTKDSLVKSALLPCLAIAQKLN